MKTSNRKGQRSISKPRQTRSRNMTCQKLLDAGLKIFCRHGYDAATTKLVAKESGVNESLINRYFHGKQGLLHTVIETFAKDFSVKMLNYPLGDNAEEEIYNYCVARFDASVESQAFLKIAISRSLIEAETKSKIKKVLETTTHQGVPQILVDRLTLLQKRGLIRSDVNIYRTTLAISMMSMGTTVFAYLQMDVDKSTILKTYREFARDFAKGLSTR